MVDFYKIFPGRNKRYRGVCSSAETYICISQLYKKKSYSFCRGYVSVFVQIFCSSISKGISPCVRSARGTRRLFAQQSGTNFSVNCYFRGETAFYTSFILTSKIHLVTMAVTQTYTLPPRKESYKECVSRNVYSGYIIDQIEKIGTIKGLIL